MRPCIKANEIPRELKKYLPVIPSVISEERACTICPYYAGPYSNSRRCMMMACAWDDDRERFHPVLKKMVTQATREFQKIEEEYLRRKEKMDTLNSMFADELADDERKKSKCYGCPYGRAKPCIGICYVDLQNYFKTKGTEKNE